MIKITEFDSDSDIYEIKNFSELIREIQDGTHDWIVERIRTLFANEDIYEAEKAMKDLPYFTPWGTLEKEKFFLCYTGLVAIEIMDIDFENADELIKKIESIPTTCAWYQSVDLTRITIIVIVDTRSHVHNVAYRQVASFYENMLNKKVYNNNQSTFLRTYVSYSPKIYLNREPEIFHVIVEDIPENYYSAVSLSEIKII